KLYVGNLPYNMTTEGLQKEFAAYGSVVDAFVVPSHEDGTVNRGFGFVEFSKESEAQAAIKGSESKIIGGRQVFANIARPKAGEGRVGGGG
ncbi:RNA-binding protein, partial [Chytridium lagenaria]